ncbi:stage II sporulation protein M [Alicyclobacillaceae bacterium I2511]|nr:stage II sporulation protein M [Alicyclobacillaceae bacterium I2511]
MACGCLSAACTCGRLVKEQSRVKSMPNLVNHEKDLRMELPSFLVLGKCVQGRKRLYSKSGGTTVIRWKKTPDGEIATHWTNHGGWLWALAVILLAVGVLDGWVFPSRYQYWVKPGLQQLQQVASQIQAAHSLWVTMGSIFVHNAVVMCLVLLFLGMVTAGIYPAVALWTNGVVMGYVVTDFQTIHHLVGWKVFVFGMMPHGIFELTALLWSAVLGMRLGFVTARSLFSSLRRELSRVPIRGREIWRDWRQEFIRVARQLPAVVGLLLIAAIVESTLTPLLMHWALGI